MANQLKMALVHTILSLHELGWSDRRIAREVGVHRETVGRHLRLSGAKAKPASHAPLGSPGVLSVCQPYRQAILEKLEQGLSSQRIYQDLVGESGFAGSYYRVKRFVRKLGAAQRLPVRRMARTVDGVKALAA